MGQLLTLIRNQKGQMLVEILLAIALTAIMLPALLTGLFASKQGKAQQGQRVQAVALLKEAEEVVRNVRGQNWNLIATNGTFHPVISGDTWALASGSANINGLTSSILISDVYRDSSGSIVTSGGSLDLSTKKITTTISWGTPFPSSVDSTVYLTRYLNNTATLQTSVSDFNSGIKSSTVVTNTTGGEVTLGAGGGGGDWCNPTLSFTTVDLSRQGIPTAISALTGIVVTGTGGNASGPTFVKTAIAGDSPPLATISGQFNNSKANGVFTEGNYGYIATTSNSQEIQILDLTQFSDPPTNSLFKQIGSFNAPGNGQGNSIFVANNIGYMTDGNQFYTIDLSNRSGSRPQKNSSTVTLAGTGNKVIVVGNYAYVAVNSTTSQLQVIDVTNPINPSIVATASASTTQSGVDVSVNSTGTRAYLATNYLASSPTDFYIIDTTTKSGMLPKIGSGYSTGGMDPKGLSVVTGNKVVVVGTGGTKQYQVVNISTEAAPIACGPGLAISNGAYAVSSILQANSYAYSYVATGDSNAELKIILGGAGGQFSFTGTFTSAPIDAEANVTYNYFSPTFIQPNQTLLKFQLAVTAAVNNSCVNANYTFVGPDGNPALNPDGTPVSYYSSAGQFPIITTGNYTNPGRCMKYKAYFSTNDYTSSPILEDVSINYSP